MDCVFKVAFQHCFTADHASRASAFMKDLYAKAMKVLKGTDKDKLLKVRDMTKSSIYVILFDHIVNTLLPYLSDLATSLADKREFAEPFLTDTACVMHITDGCGYGEEALLDKLKDFSEFACSLTPTLFGAGHLEEKEASSAKSKAVVAAVAACIERCEAAGFDPQKQVKSQLEKLKSSAAGLHPWRRRCRSS